MFKKVLTIIAAGMLWTTTAQAAFVTISEAGLDAVYSQASFGATPVDIRIGAVTQIAAPTLLDITTDAEIFALFAMHVGPANVVNFYFVDTIDSCGGFNPAIVGCGETPGNDFVVESVFVSGPNGTEVLAHELGHNLNLPHRAGASTLMNASVNGGTDLNAAEVATILASPLVQTDAGGGLFIQINPVLIVDAINAIPVPATVLLMLVGLMAMGSRRRIA